MKRFPARYSNRFLAFPLRASCVAFVALLGATFARAVTLDMTGDAVLTSYSNTPWTLQKTGSFTPSAGNPGAGSMNWTVTVGKGATTGNIAVHGYFDLTNGNPTPIPITAIAVSLRDLDGNYLSSDIADSIVSDAATTVAVDINVTGITPLVENSASGALSLRNGSNVAITLNTPPQSIPGNSTIRIYYTANFNNSILNIAPGTTVIPEAVVNFGTFEIPTLSLITVVDLPAPIAANASVTLLDNTLTTSGTITVGSFAGLNQLLTQAAAQNVSVTVNGGSQGGTVCNAASLTSNSTTVATINGIPLIIPGISLTAADCDEIPQLLRPVPSPVSSCSQTVTYNASIFTTPNGPILSATFNPPSGSVFPFGTTPVSYTVVDAAGTWTGTFIVTVLDSEAPVITPVANMTVNTDTGKCTAKVTYSTTVTDCNPNTLSFSPASGTEFPIGTTTVTITATDKTGNTSSRTFTVTVVDNVAPVITAPNITVAAATGTCSAVVTFAATAADCTGTSLVYSLNASFTPALGAGGTFPVGTTTVYVKATDAAGNASTTTFTVTVQDMQAPTITSPLDNLTVQPDSGQCYATFLYTPTAVDNCGGAVTMTVVPASGAHFGAGTTTTVTVTATDSAGNVTTRTFTVTVGTCLGSLGNFVWADFNANGTQDSGEPGIDGVKVTLYTSTGTQVATTTTAGGGYYIFQNLTPGDYFVIFDQTTLPAGFTFTQQNVGSDTTDSDANPVTGKSEGNATVVAGGYNDTVDAGAVPCQCVNPQFGLGVAGNSAVLQLGAAKVSITGPAGGILGNVSIAPGGQLSMSGDEYVTGTIYLGAGATFNNSSHGTVNVQTNADISAKIAAAYAAYNNALTQPATQSFNKFDGSVNTITGSVGLNVISVTDVSLSGKQIYLTGPVGTRFIVRVTGKFSLTGGGNGPQIRAAGGVQPKDILYVLVGTGADVAFSGGGGGVGCCQAIVDGTLLAPYRKINLAPGLVNGELISGKDISIVSGSSVRCPCQ